ncbi:FecCD family ABC transporter permease [Uliginosibacterium sp. sgz301328]|uniref:FecCD family ABC transporter permease n=1 Tax=Uliginosibacterium sp. sgz301328 TaxID=3243764 RepID=UPI00359EBD5B
MTSQPATASLPAASGLIARAYARISARRAAVLFAFTCALLVSLVIDIATGPSSFPIGDILRGLIDRASLSVSQGVILWDVRLPYAVMAVLVGAALGLAGGEMQTVLNNPLASPLTMGVSAAAAVGASVALVLDLHIPGVSGNYLVAFSAFACAAITTLCVQLLARAFGASTNAVVLFGIALTFALNALLSLVQFMADSDTLQQIVFWTMGGLTRATWDKIAILAVVFVICGAFSLRRVWAMTALRAGEEQARSLGVAVERLRLVTLLRVSLLAAVAVAFVGTIGFIGLVAPHMARMTMGEDHRFYLPGSALAGALVLSLSSIASKLLVPGLIVPVGIVTALVGIPMFMALIVRQRGNL